MYAYSIWAWTWLSAHGLDQSQNIRAIPKWARVGQDLLLNCVRKAPLAYLKYKFQRLDHPKFVIFVVWPIFKVVKAKVVVVSLLLLMLMMSQFWVCLVKSFLQQEAFIQLARPISNPFSGCSLIFWSSYQIGWTRKPNPTCPCWTLSLSMSLFPLIYVGFLYSHVWALLGKNCQW